MTIELAIPPADRPWEYPDSWWPGLTAATAALDPPLGVMNIATAVPQALAPLLGAGIVAALAGFSGLFLVSGAVTALGALAVLPIRSVR